MTDKQGLRKRWKLPFFSIWAGQAASLLGSGLVQFALVWWLTTSTGSATVLATATLMAMLPGVFLSPFAGALVDHWNRRVVMMMADGLIALATLGLAGLFLAGAERVWMVYAVMFFRGAGGIFHWAAMQASTSLMVPEKHLSRVAGFNQTLRGAVKIVGPPAGALLLLVMASVINLLLTPASSLMPLLVTDHFGGQALELSWLESAWGIGVVVGGLVLGAWGGFRRRILTSLMGLIGVGAGFLLVGLVPPSAFSLAIVGILLAGAMNPISNGPIFSIVQAGVEPGMQGRVFTLLESMATAATPLGMIIAGPVADALGVRVWYVVGGVACVLVGVGGFLVPAIVHLEDHRAGAAAEEAGAVRSPGPAGVGQAVES